MKIEHLNNDITIVNADCLEYMKTLPDKSVDLVLTDPPYGLDFHYDTYIDTEENLDLLINRFMPEALRIGNRVAVFSGVHNIQKYPKSDWILAWVWNTTGSYGKYGFNQWQPILMYGDDIKGFGSVNNVIKSDVFAFSGMGSAGYSKDKEHPCGKPFNVMLKAVARLSNEHDTILDPFMGSGTTLVAAKQLGRKAIGVEISEKYCETAKSRLSQDLLF